MCCLRFISEGYPSDYFIEAEKNQEQICYVVVKRTIAVFHLVLSQSDTYAYLDRQELLLTFTDLFMSCELLL